VKEARKNEHHKQGAFESRKRANLNHSRKNDAQASQPDRILVSRFCNGFQYWIWHCRHHHGGNYNHSNRETIGFDWPRFDRRYLSAGADAATDSITAAGASFCNSNGQYSLLCLAGKKIWSHLGIAFTLIYASMSAINYITQLTVVRLSILNQETDGLAMFVMGNTHSIFWALASSYAFMNLAMLFAGSVFEGGRLEQSIRRLFYANGVSAVITIFGVAVDSPMIYLLGSLVPWCVIFSWATILLVMLFKRNHREYM